MTYLLAIDQGTTSSRAIIFDRGGKIVARAQRELPQSFPKDGWVEHDASGIWDDVQYCVKTVLKNAKLTAADIAAIGITNQRETTVVWDKASGKPIHPAIVWQDRRTAAFCRKPENQKYARAVTKKTGLLLDPYFSGTKLRWILDNVEGAQKRADKGELAFGTIDSWLICNLTGGKVHATDATNASRTLMFNIHTQDWDSDLLTWLNIPTTMLPKVLDCADDFGVTDAALFGAEIPVRGVAGDQQAATVGQACFESGMIKSTYGTGCFAVLNTGKTAVQSANRLLTTTAYRLNGKPTYALEGSIFVAGAAVQWLRDSLGLIGNAEETQALAESVESSEGVYLVPAFTGLGAPYWDPEARGVLSGLTRDSGKAHVVRATLESVALQTRDLFEAMAQDALFPKELRVDGGMVGNDFVTQILADVVGVDVIRPQVIETTALGAAFLAGLGAGVYQSTDEIAALWAAEKKFSPQKTVQEVEPLYAGWKKAVEKARS